MPQLNKGGKFVFGWSTIAKDGVVRIPDQAIEEYSLSENDSVILMSGSKRSGAFSVSSISLMNDSILSALLKAHPELELKSLEEGKGIKYKTRYYCWVSIHEGKWIKLPKETLELFSLNVGDKLLSIRGSNLAFDYAVKGPLVEKGESSEKEIACF